MVATKVKPRIDPNGTVKPPVRKPIRRTIRIECHSMEPLDGQDRLWVELVSLTYEEIDAVKAKLSGTLSDLWEFASPFVVAWNATRFDFESGEMQPVPPPSEWGLKAFRVLEPWVSTWLALELTRVQVSPDFLAGWAKRNATPDGTGAETSA